MIRYFKLGKDNNMSVWALREDGKERCLQDRSQNCFSKAWGLWKACSEISEQSTLVELSHNPLSGVIEINQDDAMVEMI